MAADVNQVRATRRGTLNAVAVDLDVWQSLVRFAATALVDRAGASRADLASRMGKTKSNFHGALLGRSGRIDEAPTKSFCQDLQKVLHTLHGSVGNGGHRPSLTSLYEELDETTDPDSGVRVLAAWFPDLCAPGPVRSPVEALVRGEALYDMIAMTHTRAEADRLLSGRNRDFARRTVKDLLAIAGSVPYRGVPATYLLARLGAIALPEIAKEIWRSPVGFRSVRVLGRMLWRARVMKASDLPERQLLLDDIEAILEDIENRPPLDPYPARSFYVEALRWAPGEWGWVPQRLASRAASPARPVRERMYATMLAHYKEYPEIDDLIARLRSEGEEKGEDGLQYAAAVMERVREGDRANAWIDEDGLVPSGGLHQWPPNRPEAAHVNRVVDALDGMDPEILPSSIKGGTKILVAEALLTLDGTRRRRACDILGVAQLAVPAANAISTLLDRAGDPDGPPRWLCEHAAFILGYLQQPAALPALTRVVEHPYSYDNSVVHAAAWGIGDICGQGSPWEHRHQVPVDALTRIAEEGPEAPQWAATYALAVTRQPSARATLYRLVEHTTDRLTRGLARWGVWQYEAANRVEEQIRIPSSRTLMHG
ncbi:MAG TPA: hypothetical protein VFM55_13150 [Micromonosporaceae bacterium]|nr:hypothetical protein [Micromonosporaceae bacterium]